MTCPITVPAALTRCSETQGAEVLVMDRVSGARGRTGLKDCDVTIRQGEVVGLAGLEGSGQDVFLRLACDLKRANRGSIGLQDRYMNHQTYHAFKRHGVTFMPASRLEEGLISGLSVAEHFALQEKEKSIYSEMAAGPIPGIRAHREFSNQGFTRFPGGSLIRRKPATAAAFLLAGGSGSASA